MNIWDILILLAVAGMVLLALRALRQGKAGCSCGSSCGTPGCAGNCAACGKGCAACKQPEKTRSGEGEGGHG